MTWIHYFFCSGRK